MKNGNPAVPPRAAVFDFGGVISEFPKTEYLENVAALSGLGMEALMRGFSTHRTLFDAGRIDCAEMYERMLDEAGMPRPDGKKMHEIYCADSESWAHPREETRRLFEHLRGRGWRTGILTNMSAEFAADYFFPRFGALASAADAVVVSSHEGTVKPEPRIYGIMEERLGLPPESIYFFDDAQKNVDAALARGWNAMLYSHAPGAAAAALEFLGEAGIRD